LYEIWLARKRDPSTLSVGTLRFFQGAAWDFLAWRRRAYLVTGALLLAGFGFIAVRGIGYGVDFAGGTLTQVTTTRPIDLGQLRGALADRGLGTAEVQRFGGPNGFVVRAAVTEDLPAQKATVAAAVETVAGPGQFTVARTEGVGPKVGSELRSKALIAILLSFGAVLGYLAFRFEWRFGLAAVVATAHDIVATIAFIAALNLDITLVVVAALLTVVGYSLNDTIVIFDRVRENLRSRHRDPLEQVLNRAVNETLPRTVMTGGTALATLAALAVFGGEVIRPFALVMFFGIFTGTFSSIFIASPVLAYIHRRWPSGAGAGQPVPVATTAMAAPPGG
jgi:preprotein translocase subunit SecF